MFATPKGNHVTCAEHCHLGPPNVSPDRLNTELPMGLSCSWLSMGTGRRTKPSKCFVPTKAKRPCPVPLPQMAEADQDRKTGGGDKCHRPLSYTILFIQLFSRVDPHACGQRVVIQTHNYTTRASPHSNKSAQKAPGRGRQPEVDQTLSTHTKP